MPKKSGQSQADDIEQLLEKWAEQLPAAPVSKIEDTLAKLRPRQSQSTRRPNRWRLVWLGGIAAAIIVIVMGGIVLLTSGDKTLPQPEVGLGLIPTVTPTPSIVSQATVSVASTPVGVPLKPATMAQDNPSPTATTTPAPVTATTTAQSATVDSTEAAGITPAATIIVTISGTSVALVPPTATSQAAITAKPAPAKPPTEEIATPLPVTRPPATPLPEIIEPNLPSSRVTISGSIVTLTGNSLTLNTKPEPIFYGQTTKIFVNGVAATTAALKVGQAVSIQVVRTPRGQLSAFSINITT